MLWIAIICAVAGCGSDRAPITCGLGTIEEVTKCEDECRDGFAGSCTTAARYWGMSTPAMGEGAEVVTVGAKNIDRARALWERGCQLGSSAACRDLEVLAEKERRSSPR